MAKFKYEIVKNNLSWESKSPACLCDHDLCSELGKYKAPKSRLQLNEYYLFCLKHVTAYNKSWDFYKGLNVDQIELSIRKDAIWDRPSWPLKGNPNNIISQLKEFYNNDYGLFEKERDFQNFLKNKTVEEKLNIEEYKSLKILELSLPISLEKIKKKI